MRKLILIVDDDVLCRQLLVDVLEAEGYATMTAENGTRAIELTRSVIPNLVLMDAQMPGGDGCAAIKAMRADPDTRSIPAIVVTALAMPTDRDSLLRAGFNGYLSKPIDIKKMRDEVRRHLGMGQKRAETVMKGVFA